MHVAAGQQHEYGAYYRGTHYGQHSRPSRPRRVIIPTPAGMKKKPRLSTRSFDIRSTQPRRIMPYLSDNARKSIPMMLDGIGTPVSFTKISPTARNSSSTAHWRIIILQSFYWGAKLGKISHNFAPPGQNSQKKMRFFLPLVRLVGLYCVLTRKSKVVYIGVQP